MNTSSITSIMLETNRVIILCLKRFDNMLLINRDAFLTMYADLANEVIAILIKDYELSPDVVAYVREMFDYNVPGGKLNRGMAVIDTLAVLKGATLSENEIRKA